MTFDLTESPRMRISDMRTRVENDRSARPSRDDGLCTCPECVLEVYTKGVGLDGRGNSSIYGIYEVNLGLCHHVAAIYLLLLSPGIHTRSM